MGKFRDLTFAALAVLLAGCAVGPNYHRPAGSVPASYPQTLPGATNQPAQDLARRSSPCSGPCP